MNKDKQMELTEVDILANDINQCCADLAETYCGDTNCLTCLAHALIAKDYRKLSENVIELPCKVGDTVYMPWEYKGVSGVAILTVTHIIIDNVHSYIRTDFQSDCEEYWLAYNCGRFDFRDFGKKVFTKQDEAEKALENRSEE